MDLLDKIEADMTKLRPVSVKKPQTPLNASPNAWNRQPSGSNTNIKPIEAVPEEKPKPLFFKPGTMPFISTGRIPKRDSKEIEGPNAKRWAGHVSKSATQESFRPFDLIDIQLNTWKLDTSAMEDTIHKILFQVTLCQENGTRFELQTGLSSVGGDTNRQIKRRAQYVLFVNWFKKNPQLFNGNTNPAVAAYDCAETIYIANSNYQGGLEEHTFIVTEKDVSSDDWFTLTRISRRKNITFEVRVKAIGKIFTQGKAALTDTNRPELTRCIETVTNQILNNGNFFLYNTGTFEVQGNVLLEPDETSEVKTGFTKEPKVVEDENGNPSVSLTIDTVSSAFYKPMPMTSFVVAKYAELAGGERSYHGDRGRDRRTNESGHHRRDRGNESGSMSETKVKEFEKMFAKKNLITSYLEKVNKAMKGLECESSHLKNAKANRSVFVDKLYHCNAHEVVFDWKTESGTKQISVYEYYREQYSYTLKYPELPLVVSKRLKTQNFFPLELLTICPGQRIKNSAISAALQGHMTRTICALPFQHVQQTQRFLKDVLKIESSRVNPYLQAFKLSFPTNNPIRAKGRILAPPIIQFYKQNFIPDPRKSVRFSGKGKFIEPARIRSVAILNVDKGFRSVTKFAEQMERHCREQGITFEKPARDWKVVETHSEDTAGVKTFLSECLHKKVTIVVAIVNEKKPDIHDVLKYYEEKMGQQTIQICTDTAIKIMSEHGGKQTLENVLRKFNPKAGGTNFYLNIAPTVCGTSITPDATRLHEKLFARTQFIGFELSHTGARTQYDKQAELFDGEPTVVGVSYSLRQSTQLGGFSYFQPTREHKLSRLEEKFQICVDAYEKSAQSLPETIVVYRVGSGEGDFKRIFEEVNDMRKSAERTKQGYHPKFICILTQRHCHVRLFPERIQGRKAQEQNVPSGTVLETNVYRNGFDEFIMCCQTPMIGTSRPTKYTVLVNDANWSVNELMQITYYLSFGHQVSYAPPAVPDVLYAASNLAKRGRNNFKTHKKLSNLEYQTKKIIDKNRDIISQENEDMVLNLIIDSISDKVNNLTIKSRNFWA